ncbi:MAG TPA: hypothetical protein H9856_04260 [Candidatus Limosilactobacillus merdigallinarum]|uniref:Phage protein n=1 Tax=Candidatus Limosilactobacillus merdigallinarum TaxID=2838652 RepID=A0A9D1VHQ5_9LACO|nr:hypothetical protein [Candidatus Limosilactobacillus merdigallinarum]
MNKLDKDEQRLFDLLPKGMERPRPLKELVNLTGWPSRKVRGTIYRLIVLHHRPIGAIYQQPGNGYFIITNDTERNKALAPLTSQIAMMTKRAQVISNSKLEEQS